MPARIQQHCGNRANSMEWQYKSAFRKLQLGAIALGEAHDNPCARAIIFDLIEAHLVQKLFLEMGELEEWEKFRSNDKLGKDIAEDEEWQQIAFVIRYLDNKWGNPVTFAELLRAAVLHNVQVFFFDNAAEPNPSTPQGMKNRNETMGAVFQEHSDGAEPGAVVLIGSEHLYPIPSGGLYEHTIQAACGIRFQHVVDLGRLKG